MNPRNVTTFGSHGLRSRLTIGLQLEPISGRDDYGIDSSCAGKRVATRALGHNVNRIDVGLHWPSRN